MGYCTETLEGPIPHLWVKFGDLQFLAPVKVVLDDNGRVKVRPGREYGLGFPLRHLGRLVYALPGGGEMIQK